MTIKNNLKQTKEILLATTIIGTLLISGNGVTANGLTTKVENVVTSSISPNKYADYVPSSYWAKNMSWAIEQDLINGYVNKKHPTTGKMGNWINPYGMLTEAQFLAILFRYAKPEELSSTKPSTSHWASVPYQLAKKYDLPTVATLTNTSKANAAITRGTVARILGSLDNAGQITERSAIQWMYDNNISTGYPDKNGNLPKTYASFGPENQLTRAQLVSFLKRYHDLASSGKIIAPTNKSYLYADLSVSTINSYTYSTTQDYHYGNYFRPSTRYLFKDAKKGMTNLLDVGNDGNIYIQQFGNSFKKADVKNIKMELPIFGGFHAGEDGYYYVIYGQRNEDESDTKTVYRLVKYNDSWTKISHIDLKDVYVSAPFHASNVTMDSYNGKLAVHSARSRYRTEDGLIHQSNISFLFDTKNMTVLEKGGKWPSNYVSHSFATYVRFDGEDLVYADHGDAYPRSIVLQVEEDGISTRNVDLVYFTGKIGDNYTGAQLGGLEVASSNYLVVGIATERIKNVFLSVVSKNDKSEPKRIAITNYNGADKVYVDETHLIKIDENKFVLMWKERNLDPRKQVLVYSVVDGQGSILQKNRKLLGVPSPGNMEPLVQGNTVTWYGKNLDRSGEPIDDEVSFYTLYVNP